MVPLARKLAAVPVAALAIGTPWTCNLVVGPPASSGSGAPQTSPAPRPPPSEPSPEKRVETAQARASMGSGIARNAPGLPVRLPEESVVRALDLGNPMFARCFKRAHDTDPTWSTIKVKIQLEIDATGAVSGVKTDAADATLSACLARIARNIPFPAPGKAAVIELPLFFRT